ncbi:unnamed protein product [Closterium sp. Yama58-4]|nr:unnamed protein product [Closterium sp. Yama58-4]
MSSIAAAMGQLPRFDDRAPDPKVWISQATRAIRCFLSAVTEDQQLDYLLMHLTESAYVWAESKEFTTVAGFDKAFRERFIWESTANVMQRLTGLKQKPGQTVMELADEVRQLAAYVPNYPVAMSVRHFIEGLGDKSLREKVLGGRPVSLEAAEEAAKYFVSYSLPMGIEPVPEAAKEKGPGNKESEVDKITKQLEKLSISCGKPRSGMLSIRCTIWCTFGMFQSDVWSRKAALMASTILHVHMGSMLRPERPPISIITPMPPYNAAYWRPPSTHQQRGGYVLHCHPSDVVQ